jgi:ABC-type nitrate/sulfonate/bicarbonate transport system permease component
MTVATERPTRVVRGGPAVAAPPDVEPEVRRLADAGLLVPIVVAAGLLLVWEVLARSGVLKPVLFSSPMVIGRTLVASFASGEMTIHVIATLTRTLAGLALGAIPGLLLGLAMGWSGGLRRALDPIFAALHPIPKIAILPLLMIFLGIGEASRIAVAAVAAFFPMLINTMAGVRAINPIYFEVAQNYGASKYHLFRRVVLPASLPLVFSGLRLAANVTLLVTIAAEIVMADRGLGAQVWLAWETLRVELLYATLVVIASLGIALTGGLRLIRRAAVPWQVDAGVAR